jgi:hypothetical protein
MHVAGSRFIFSDHRCAKLEINLDPKSRHDAGLNIFPGIE